MRPSVGRMGVMTMRSITWRWLIVLLTAGDVAASWQKLIFPPEGVTSARQSFFLMVDTVEAPDPATVVFRLKFATGAFLPALADPYNWVYKKAILDRDPHWYEKNIL